MWKCVRDVKPLFFSFNNKQNYRDSDDSLDKPTDLIKPSKVKLLIMALLNMAIPSASSALSLTVGHLTLLQLSWQHIKISW